MRSGARGPPPDEIALRRRRNAAAELEAPLPLVFTGHPVGPPPVAVAGDRFKGWAGSPGRYEGPGRVVTSPAGAALRRGDVLVARTTDASWLPLFHVAGAIVVEEGGPLSHAAILARELGMPAVVNVPGIVERVARDPGAVISVDGTAGVVGVHAPGVDDPRDDPAVSDPTSGLAPARRLRSVGDPDRLNVFITGLIGASAIMSVANRAHPGDRACRDSRAYQPAGAAPRTGAGGSRARRIRRASGRRQRSEVSGLLRLARHVGGAGRGPRVLGCGRLHRAAREQ